MSWPRGSNMRPVRIQSYSARKCWRRSNIVSPFSWGMLPPPTTRTGLPQVWPSMQKKVWRAMASLAGRMGLVKGGGGGDRSPAVSLSGCPPQSHIGKRRPGLQRLGHDRLHVGAVLALESQARWAGERGAAAHDLLAELDALDEIGPSVEVEQRHEPVVERARLLVAPGL